MSDSQVEVDLVLTVETPCCDKTVTTAELGFNSSLETGQHDVDCPKCGKSFTLSLNESY